MGTALPLIALGQDWDSPRCLPLTAQLRVRLNFDLAWTRPDAVSGDKA